MFFPFSLRFYRMGHRFVYDLFDTDEQATQFSPNHSSKAEATKPLSPIAENQKNNTENAEVLVQL